MPKQKEPWKRISFLLILPLLLAGCASLEDPETSQVHDLDVVAVLPGTGSRSVNQSFISRRSGLDSITLALSSSPGEEAQTGALAVALYRNLRGSDPVFHTTLSSQGITSKAPLKISFPPVLDPPGTRYIIDLAASGKSLQVYGRREDIYPQGELLEGNKPEEADLFFRTTYRYNWKELQLDIANFLKSLWIAFPLGLMLVLPGWVLVTISGLRDRFDFASLAGTMAGLSLAGIPIALLWTTVLGGIWSPRIVRIGLGILAAFTIGWEILQWGRKKASSQIARKSRSPENLLVFISLVVIFFAALAIRLVMVRDLATPAWIDSVHHSLITRQILENGKYAFSLAPYFDFQATDYHTGFHSLAASFVWLTGIDLQQALLIFGQVLNALMVFSVFLLTKTLTNDARAGLFSAALVGFFTPMPAYYASWGRYTQLAGLLILPAVVSLWRALVSPDVAKPWACAWLPGLAAGGLFLVHYRVAAFFGLLILVDIFCHAPTRPVKLRVWLRRIFIVAFPAAAFGILAAFPWIFPALTKSFLPTIVSTPVPRTAWFNGFSWKYLNAGAGTYTLWLAALGLILGILQRKRFSVAIFLWVALLLLFPNLSALGLPGGSLVNMTAIEISLFMPIACSGGYLVSQIFTFLHRLVPTSWKTVFTICFTGLLVGLGLLGSRATLTIFNPATALSRSADLPAIAWVKSNIPIQEPIAINPFLWGYGLYAGVDGGYWITPLTGRPTLPPTALYGFADQATIQSINQVSEKLVSQGKDADALWKTLKAAGIQYVFLGARGGPISPKALVESPFFQVMYEADGAWIFKTK